MEEQLIRERYELSMARIRRFQDEDTVREPYRSYFKKISEFIGLCGSVMEAVTDGSIKQWGSERLPSMKNCMRISWGKAMR